MGAEELIPLILSGVGTAVQMSAQQDAADQRRTITNQQLDRDSKATDKSIQMVQDQGQKFGADARQQGLDQQAGQAYTQTQKDIAGAGAGNIETAGDAGAVSDDFLKSKAARAIDEGNRLTTMARLQSKARAPGMLEANDSIGQADLAGRLQDLWGSTKNMANATSLDAQNVSEPAYGALGSIASAIGGGMGGAGVGGAGGNGVILNMMNRAKYAGSSNNPSAPNYTNSMDAGVNW